MTGPWEGYPEAPEGVDVVDFGGQVFRIPVQVGIMPLLMFARAAQAGLGTYDYEGLAAMHRLLEDCIEPEDWTRFQDAAVEVKADDDALLEVVKDVMAVVTDRPTRLPSDSSDGQSKTQMTSLDESFLRAVEMEAGRPDVQLVLLQRYEDQHGPLASTG